MAEDFRFSVVCPSCRKNHQFEGESGITSSADVICECGAGYYVKAYGDGRCEVTIGFRFGKRPNLRVVPMGAVVK